jgi:hypothetical protein
MIVPASGRGLGAAGRLSERPWPTKNSTVDPIMEAKLRLKRKYEGEENISEEEEVPVAWVKVCG